MKIVSPCWRPSPTGERRSDEDQNVGRADGLMWYKDLGRHVAGDFSMAVIQANSLLEDGSQIESGPLISSAGSRSPAATFVGVYDGHGGPETARYCTDHMYRNLKKFASEEQGMSTDVIKKAYRATEEGFLSTVRKQWLDMPQLASVGACSLVGVIYEGMLYVANAGDSRAVLGKCLKGRRELSAVQMTTEHNANSDSVRKELQNLHPDDPEIVVLKHKVWRVKGIIQISKSIGDAYLKNSEFNREPLLPKFRVSEPFQKSILSAEPSIESQRLSPEDQFIIFASDGLWDHLSNQEAVDIVHHSPRNGIARRLIKAALKESAKKREMRYADLKKIDRGIRRHFHDDITVIVLFLDPIMICKTYYNGPVLSLRGGGAASVQLPYMPAR